MGRPHPRQRRRRPARRSARPAPHRHASQRLFRHRFPSPLRRLRRNRRHHARIHQSTPRPRSLHRRLCHRRRRPPPPPHHDDHASRHPRPPPSRHVARDRLRLPTPLRHSNSRRPNHRPHHGHLPPP